MPSISVGQAENLLSAGLVSYPTYTNGSLSKNQYPCKFTPPDNSKRPEPIPLGSFDPSDEFQHYRNAVPSGYAMPLYQHEKMVYNLPNEEEILSKEEYIDDTQHKKSGEFSDLTILGFSAVLLLVLMICTYLSFKM